MIADDVIVVLTDLQPAIVAHSRADPEARLRRARGVLVDGASALRIPVLRSVIRLTPSTAPEVINELHGEPPVVRTIVGVLDHEESHQPAAQHHDRTAHPNAGTNVQRKVSTPPVDVARGENARSGIVRSA